MKGTFKKIIALIMTVALVATTITFTAGNTLKAESENPGESTATEQKAEPAPEPAPEKSEPAVQKQEVVVEADKDDSSSESAKEEPAESADSSQAESTGGSSETAAPSDNDETAEEEAVEEEANEEEEMPAQTFSRTASNGIVVNVSAPEGAFPAGTTMRVTAVSHAKAMSLAEAAVEDASDANGVDITFFKDGKEIQPEKNISVRLGNAGVEGESFGMYHVEDNGSIEKIGGATANGGSFRSDEFSIYIVIGQDEDITIPDALQLNVRFLNSSHVEIADSDTKFIEERNEQGQYTVEYTLPSIEGKTPDTLEGDGADFSFNEDKTRITATVNPIEQEEGAETQQQSVSCDIIYSSGIAEYTVKHVFEKKDATDDTPDDQRYEENPSLAADITLEGEIGSETAAEAQPVSGYEAQEIDQDYIAADGSTVVTVKYNRNSFFLTYDTQGGSYIKGKDVKYGGDVEIYSIEGATPEHEELTCTKAEHQHGNSCYSTVSKLTCNKTEHTHTAKPTDDPGANKNKGKTKGCWKSTASGGILGFGAQYTWELNCGLEGHTHNSSCYSDVRELTCKIAEHTHSKANGCYTTVPGTDGTCDPNPTKEGYTFEGWYLDSGYAQKAPEKLEDVQADITVYAKWKPGTAKYTIVYYVENADDNGYSFDSNGSGTATVGNKVDGTQKTIDGFTYNSSASDHNVVVKPDGSTVVKMYYSRNTYTFTFKNGSTTIHSFSAKWGSYIGDRWSFKGSDGKQYPRTDTGKATSWTPSGSKTYTTRIIRMETMPKENITFSYTTSSNTVRTFYYYVEAVEGGSKTFDNKKFDLYLEETNDFNRTYYNDEFFIIDGYDRYKITDNKGNVLSKKAGDNWETYNPTYFYYTICSYTLTKMSGGVSTAETYKYGQSIANAGNAPAKPEGKEDYTFGGWYENENCEGDAYSFTGKTMPASNMVLYAKWVKPDKKVTVKYQNGEKDDVKVVAKGDKVTIDTPARAGYNFAGWYTAAEGGEEFDINAPVTDDVTVYAHWKAKSKVLYTVEFVTVDGETVAPSYTDEGKAGSKVKADAVPASGKFEGYNPDAASKTITLDQDSSKNVITFKYSDKNDFLYRIVYKCGDTVIQEGDEVTVHQNRVRVAATDIPKGYEISGAQYQTVTLGYDETTDVVFQLKAKEYKISYENIGDGTWEAGAHPGTYTLDQLKGKSITITGLTSDTRQFLGWDFTAKNADGTSASITPAGSHIAADPVIEDGTYGDLVFTAVWGTVTAEDVQKTYDGESLGINTPSVNVPAYCYVGEIQYSKTGKDGSWSNEIPVWTDAGEYTTYVRVKINGYRYIKTTAKVTISKRNVTLTSATDSKTYDGTALTNNNVTIGGQGFAGSEGADFNVTGSQTEKGESPNTFTYKLKNNTKESNYNITKKEGTLTVTGNKDVVVTIKENSGNYTYDGTTKTVTGYSIVSVSNTGYTAEDFTFDGNASVSGRNAGTYDMEIKASDFHNINDNYDSVTFVVQDGQLVISPITDKIIITAASNNSKLYDGTPLTDDGYSYTQNILRDGDVLTAVVEGSQTDAGTSANVVKSYKVMRGDEDVTGNYTFGTSVNGTLEVNKRTVILTSESARKVYDGTALRKEEVKISGDGFVEGQGATFSDFAQRLQVGTIDNTFKYTLKSGTKAENYNISKVNGTLTVTLVADPITIKANDASKVYDGNALTDPGFTYTEGILKDGDVLKAVVTGSQTDAGTSANVVTSYQVMRGDEDVTENYQFETPVPGTLTVNKRPVTLTSADGSWTYDGNAHQKKEVTVSEGEGVGFVGNDGATYSDFASITKAAESPKQNTFEYTLKDGTKAANYEITKVPGTLTIAKKGEVKVTITEHSGEFTYDGTEKTVSGYDVSISDELYTADDFEFTGDNSHKTVSRTDVGESSMQLEAADFRNKNEDFENVTFEIIQGTLKIKPVSTPITITANSNSKTYDGTALTDNGYSFTQNVLAANDELKVVINGSIKDVGTAANKVSSYKVMRGDKDVTSNYTFSDSVDGTLTVSKRNVTIKSSDAEKVYDGTALTKHEVSVEGDDFVNGDTASYSFSGSQLEIGSSDNTFTYSLAEGVNADNYNITTEFGTLTVTKNTKPITITAASAEKKYDGKALTNGGYTFTQNVLASGDVLTAVVEGSQTVAGSSANTVTSYKVMHGSVDVTNCYTFNPVINGTLTVTKRHIVLTSATDEKTYDGTPLTNDTITETGDGFIDGGSGIMSFFAKGEGYTAHVTGSQTQAGTSANSFTYTLNEGTSAANYEIEKVEGKLTVCPVSTPIIITAASADKTYDGKALTKDAWTSNAEGILIGGDTLEAVIEGSQKDAGSSANTVTSYVVKNAEGQSVTGSYIFGDPVQGTLTVNKRDVTLTAASDSKEYDGTPLTNDKVTVTAGSFADGEGFTAAASGSQTEVGGEQGNNPFEYTLNEGTKAGNYNITKINGTLTVTPVDAVVVTIKGISETKEYNGKEQKVNGYTVESSNPKYKVTGDDVFFDGPSKDSAKATAKGTNAGTYTMEMSAGDFSNTNPNFTNVTFVVEPGTLTITRPEKALVVTADSGSKMYDGTALTKDSYTFTEGVLAEGDELAVVVEGSITNAGTAVNTVKSVKVMHGDTDVSANYNIGEAVNGTLTVTKRTVTFTSATDKKEYDGTPLTNDKVTVGGDGFAEEQGASFNVTGSQTEAGSSENSFSYTLNSDTNAANYVISTTAGTLTVEKAENVIISITGNNNGDSHYTYNGSRQTVEGFTFVASCNTKDKTLITRDSFTYSGDAVAAGTDAGTYQMNLDVSRFTATADTLENFKSVTFQVTDGFMVIDPVGGKDKTIVITASSGSRMYDGTALTAGYTFTEGVLLNGDVLTAVVSGSQTDAGSSDNLVTSWTVKHGEKDVTGNYTFADPVKGTLTVTKRNILITSDSADKTYDGTPLYKHSAQITGDGFADGEGVSYSNWSSITDVGNTANHFEYALNSNTDENNYVINVKEGVLTVAPVSAELVIKADSAGKKYDGKALTCPGYTYTEGVLAKGDVLTAVVSGSQTDAGTSSSTITEWQIKRGNDDVTHNYTNVKTENGTLEVTKRNVTLTSADGSKVYDGQPLTNASVTEGGDKFVSGEGASYNVTGTITDPGSVFNTFEYELNSGTKAENYNITKKEGTLTVTEDSSEIIVTIKGNTKTETYDGTEKTVSGYEVTSISSDKYKKTDISFSGTDKVSKTDAGTYSMGLKASDFTNINTRFTNVKFVVTDGQLVINPVEKKIIITADSDSRAYNGEALTNPGFTYTEDVLVKGDRLTAVVEGIQTDAGKSTNSVISYKVMRGDTDVTANYTFGETVDGTLEVTKRNVTLTSATDSKTYDGTALENSRITVGGQGFAAGEGYVADVTGSQTEVGSSSNTFTYELAEGTKAGNYNITKEVGTLTVKAVAEKVTVTVTGNKAVKEYNGSKQSVNGYTVEISNSLYTENDFSFTGSDVAEGIAAGTYDMGLTAENFSNTNTAFTNVEFVINDGSLEITPIKAKITVTAGSGEKMYDGTALSEAGYTYTEGVLLEGDVLTAETEGKITSAGSVPNRIVKNSVRVMRGSLDVTDCYSFASDEDGILKVTKRNVVLTSENAAKPYDGTALVKEAVNVSGDGFASGEGASYDSFASITNVGITDNSFKYHLNNNTNADNYTIKTEFGQLEITKKNDVVVTITGNSKKETFDGTEKTVEGYTWEASCNTGGKTLYKESDFTFSGKALVSGKDAGTYPMGLKEADFANTNSNFDSVVFVVNDGSLIIDPVKEKITVTITEHSGKYDYDGTEKTVTGFDWKASCNTEESKLYKRTDFNFTGNASVSGTDAGIYEMELKADDFTNTNTNNFSNVEFVIVDGQLQIDQARLVIKIRAASDSKVYDGTPLEKKGANDWSYAEGSARPIAGDRVVVVNEGTITDAGKAANVPSVKIMRGDTDVTSSYSKVEGEAGTLEVTKRKVTLTSATATKVYDGKALTDSRVAVTGDGWAKDEGAVYDVRGTITDPGTVKNTFGYELTGGAKEGNYVITTVQGDLTVTKVTVPIVITAASASKKYDGTALTDGGYTYTQNVLASGDVLTAVVTGSQTSAGTSANTVESYVVKRGETDVTANYTFGNSVDGELTVSKRNITLTSGNGSWTYDGQSHSVSEVSVTGDGWASGEGAEYSDFATIKNTGEKENTFTYTLNSNTDASNYKINVVKGKLTVAKKGKVVVTITGKSATEEYNGSEQTVSGYDISISDPLYTAADFKGPAQDSAKATAKGTDVGSYTNMTMDSGDFSNINEDFENVEFRVSSGTLTITPVTAKLVVTAATDSKTYDGTALTNSGWTLTSGSLMGSDRLEVTVTGSQKNAGSSPNEVSVVKVMRGNTEVTGNYSFGQHVNGTLTVEKKAIKLTSATDSKVYDGTALENRNVTVSGTGFAEGEGASYSKWTSITEVGEKSNSFEYTLNEGTDAGNYNISTEFGKLSVTAVTDPVTVTITEHSGSFTYDGTVKEVKGYDFKADNDLYKAEYVSFTGNASVSGTYAGTYDMLLTADNFANTSSNFANVTFVITDGQLKINPNRGKIEIAAASDKKTYDGTELKNSGYTVTEDNVLAAGDTVVPAVRGSQTDAGSSENVIAGYRIMNGTKDVTDCYSGVETKNGTLTVDKRTVTLTSATDMKVYDGEALTNHSVTAGGEGFAAGEGYTAEVSGSQTEVGSSDNEFEITLNEGTKKANYNISLIKGKLTVTDPGAVVVKIQENSAQKEYNGSQQSVSGYTVLSISNKRYKESYIDGPAQDSAKATASGTEVGTYNMNLKPEDFANRNRNFKDVQFVIVDGTLEITPVTEKVVVKISGQNKTETYDGTIKTVNGYSVDSISNNKYKESFFEGPAQDSAKATASGMKAGEYRMTMSGADFTNISRNFTNVVFEVTPGKLVIDPVDAAIIIKAKDGSKTYDGTALTKKGYDVEGELINGDEVTNVAVSGSQTDAGTSFNVVTAYRITRNGVDVTDSYSGISVEQGVLTVDPRVVTLASASASKEYDGTDLTKNEVKVKGETGFAPGEGFTANTTGSQTDVGESANTFEYSLNEGTKAGNYTIKIEEGILKVTRNTKAIVITASSSSRMYNGKPLTDATYTYTEGVLASGDVLTAVVEGSGTNAGIYDNRIVSYKVMRGGREVTDYYTFEKPVDGSLTIDKRSVMLTSATDSKIYDGRALTNHKVEVTGDGFIEGEGAEFNVTGSQTEVGESANTFEYELKEGTLVKNYNISTREGTLSVTEKDGIVVTITENSGSFTYDGTEKTVSGYTVSVNNPLYTENDFTFTGGDRSTIRRTNVGETEMKLQADDFVNNNRNFRNVRFVIVDGSLKIEPKILTIQIKGEDVSKVYDGTPLTGGSTVSGEKPVSGKIVVNTSGSQTDAGQCTNKVDAGSIRVIDGGRDLTENYLIKAEISDGTITVTKRTVNLKSESGYKIYDGTPLTKPEVEVTGDGFVKGEVSDIIATGSVTYVEEGEVTNTITFTKGENFKDSNYSIVKTEGILYIVKKADEDEIIITADSNSKLYDGKPLTDSGYTYTEGILEKGDELTATVEGRITNAGSVKNTVTSWKVMNGDKDVTENYKFGENVDGTLTVMARKITITSASASKKYDGRPLTAPTIKVGGRDGLAEGQQVIAAFNHSGQTEVGSMKNTFNYTIVNLLNASSQNELDELFQAAAESDLSKNYDVTVKYGTLTVKDNGGEIVPVKPSDGNNNGTDGNTVQTGLVASDGAVSAEIGGGDTPLANSLMDSCCCILHLILMLLALIMLIWYTKDMKNRQRKIHELEKELSDRL